MSRTTGRAGRLPTPPRIKVHKAKSYSPAHVLSPRQFHSSSAVRLRRTVKLGNTRMLISGKSIGFSIPMGGGLHYRKLARRG